MLGANRNVGKYVVEDETRRRYDLIYFGDMEGFHGMWRQKYGAASLERLYKTGAGKNGGEEIVLSIVYYPDVNEYRGTKSLQMVMKYYQ